MNQTSLFAYFVNAGLIVKFVMIVLLIASVISWTIILQRAWYFRLKQKQYKEFIKQFGNSRDLNKLYADLDNSVMYNQGLVAIFHAGFKEYIRSYKQQTAQMLEFIQRSMQISQAKEAIQLTKHLPFLASVGSISPYIGLFGTVWGIMTSFQALGQAQQATIAMVAPGIAEALIATALGLFTAIPAVLAYNKYNNNAQNLLDHYNLFQEEFINLIGQQTV